MIFILRRPGRQPTGFPWASGERSLVLGVPYGDPGRSEIDGRLLGLFGKSPQPGLRVSTQPLRGYLRQMKILVSF